ncbi:MAG: RNA 2',3'-cyclic phosphodiesterase [Opitutales bacterium]|nr:RNA 2',3'-cyclic phosphodiesterase [Opitutales bacterium]
MGGSSNSGSGDPPLRGTRLFVAAPVPGYVKEALARLRDDRWNGFHWVGSGHYHLTLRFIGDVPGQFQGEIEAALEKVSVAPFFLPVEGVGRFPAKGSAHAVWAGLGSAHPRLFSLKKQIEDAFFRIGLEPEKRVYQPHLTIARVNHAAEETVRQFLKEHAAFGAAPFRMEMFGLYRSELRPEGRLHIEERTWAPGGVDG